MKAKIFDIERTSFVDGPGIKTTFFLKGCNMRCKWCHNPESQLPDTQIMFYKSKCTGCGRCREVCPYDLSKCDTHGMCDVHGKCDMCDMCADACLSGARQLCGKEYTADEVLEIALKDKLFYDTSGGGVTFSGGECMLQIEFLEEILKDLKKAGINTAVDTAGNVPWESFEKIISCTDVFLYDVKCFSERLHIEGTGVSNRRILENLRMLSDCCGGDIIIRIPVIPGFNANTEEMCRISEFLKTIRYSSVELLPYHEMGKYKYEALGMDAVTYPVPEKEDMKKFSDILNNAH